MQRSKDILGWYFKPSDFKFTAEHLFSNDTKNQVSICMQKMRDLAIRLPEGIKLPETNQIVDIYYLFQDNFNQEYTIILSHFSKRDVRILVWSLDYQPLKNSKVILFSEQFDTAIRIILDKWRDSFIITLWHILLKNWSALQDYSIQRITLTRLLSKKCSEYNRSRKDILNISENINLFLKRDSPIDYTISLLHSNLLISEANSLINQKESLLVYDYYSKVVESYVELIAINQINHDSILDIYKFLKKHNSKKTDLLICSNIINNSKFNNFTEIIKKETVNIVGDPVKKHLWKYSGLTENQETSIELARNKLKILLNKDFIDIFFEKLVQDNRRKEYWLKLIDEIDDIKFVGNRSNYLYLKKIESISQFVDSRYKITSRNQNTSAIIIYSKGFVFVEFTDTGALYIYKNQNFNVNLNAINNMEDLKIWPTYKYACKNTKYSGYVFLNEEGRITHQGDWELRANAWMKEYYYD